METLVQSLKAFIADSLPEYLTQLLCSYLLGERLTTDLVLMTRASTFTFRKQSKITKLDIRAAAHWIAIMKRYDSRALSISFHGNPKGAERLHLDIVEGIKLWKKHHKED